MAETSEIFRAVKERVTANPSRVAGLDAGFQFDLQGDGGGVYHVDIAGGVTDVGAGPSSSPNVTITMAAADFAELATGKLNPVQAFMSGKLKLKGDLGLALRLQSILG